MELEELCDSLFDWCVANKKDYADLCFINNGINYCIDRGITGRYEYERAVPKGFVNRGHPYIEVAHTKIDWSDECPFDNCCFATSDDTNPRLYEDERIKSYTSALHAGSVNRVLCEEVARRLWFADFILDELDDVSAIIEWDGITFCIDADKTYEVHAFIKGAAAALGFLDDYGIVKYDSLKEQEWYLP